jgi:hypothetical protein
VILHHELDGPGGAHTVLVGGSLGTTLEMWDRQLPLAAELGLVASTTAATAARRCFPARTRSPTSAARCSR